MSLPLGSHEEGFPIARKKSGKKGADKREWVDLLEEQAANRESDFVEQDWSEYDGDDIAETIEEVEKQVDKSLSKLDKSSSKYHWMKEKRFANIFSEIEGRLSGALGKGQFHWVDRRVFDEVFDQSTLLAIYKLMQQDHLDTLEWPVARGKEAHVFHGLTNEGAVAVKIFHTSNAVFKGLMQYIEGDPRFGGLRRRHRELVTVWVQKESRNLIRMRKAGVRVPEPLAWNKNVLIMDYLGDDEGPSPRLRDVKVPDPQAVYDDLLEQLRLIWQEAGLAHADFSDYNIMWHEGETWIIDAGQAVMQSHPSAKEFLVRDVERLVQWANRNGLNVELADALVHVVD